MPSSSTARTCRGCAHFFVTYDPAFPYGCRMLGFKSRRTPCIEVEEAAGQPCLAREERRTGKEKADQSDD